MNEGMFQHEPGLGELSDGRYACVEGHSPLGMATGTTVELWKDTTEDSLVVVKAFFKRTLAQRKVWRHVLPDDGEKARAPIRRLSSLLDRYGQAFAVLQQWIEQNAIRKHLEEMSAIGDADRLSQETVAPYVDGGSEKTNERPEEKSGCQEQAPYSCNGDGEPESNGVVTPFASSTEWRIVMQAVPKFDHVVSVMALYESTLDCEGRDYGSIFLVQEYCKLGQSLGVLGDNSNDVAFFVPEEIVESGSEVVNADGRYSGDFLLRLIRGLLQAVDSLHSGGWVHGDIKPQNIFLTADSEAKLGDFDLLRRAVARGKNGELWVDALDGTVQFRPPEAWTPGGNKMFDGRAADLWSVGLTVYCWCTNRLPFANKDYLDEVIPELDIEEVLRQSSVPIDSAVSDLIANLMSREPASRFSAAKWLIRFKGTNQAANKSEK